MGEDESSLQQALAKQRIRIEVQQPVQERKGSTRKKPIRSPAAGLPASLKKKLKERKIRTESLCSVDSTVESVVANSKLAPPCLNLQEEVAASLSFRDKISKFEGLQRKPSGRKRKADKQTSVGERKESIDSVLKGDGVVPPTSAEAANISVRPKRGRNARRRFSNLGGMCSSVENTPSPSRSSRPAKPNPNFQVGLSVPKRRRMGKAVVESSKKTFQAGLLKEDDRHSTDPGGGFNHTAVRKSTWQ